MKGGPNPTRDKKQRHMATGLGVVIAATIIYNTAVLDPLICDLSSVLEISRKSSAMGNKEEKILLLF